MKTFNETKWMPGKVVIEKAKLGGTEVNVKKPNQKGNASVFIYAKDSKGYVEIELTATKATVILSWVVDTFDKDGGRCMVDLKDMLLQNNSVSVTAEEYDAAIIEQVGETEVASRQEAGPDGLSFEIRQTVQRFKYNLP